MVGYLEGSVEDEAANEGTGEIPVRLAEHQEQGISKKIMTLSLRRARA